jgi:hypothetical protein
MAARFCLIANLVGILSEALALIKRVNGIHFVRAARVRPPTDIHFKLRLRLSGECFTQWVWRRERNWGPTFST